MDCKLSGSEMDLKNASTFFAIGLCGRPERDKKKEENFGGPLHLWEPNKKNQKGSEDRTFSFFLYSYFPSCPTSNTSEKILLARLQDAKQKEKEKKVPVPEDVMDDSEEKEVKGIGSSVLPPTVSAS